MTSHVYYGEYTLQHWINLMLSKNIVLPEYQRSFVWKERDIKRLIYSLSEGQFVQPVTIALYKSDAGNNTKNLLIDGQQRLTSILLTFLGYIPDVNKFERPEQLATGDDSADDDDNSASDIPIKWTFKEILNKHSGIPSIDKIKQDLDSDDRYIKFNTTNIDDDFFEKTFLGFSYIVPDNCTEADIQNSFAKLFRNINYLGKHLSSLESRRSLYYTNDKYKSYFDGLDSSGADIFGGVGITEKLQSYKLDFVRYLSILSQYSVTEDKNKVLVGYSAYASREAYFADYVSYLLGLEQESRYDKFDGFKFKETFPDVSCQSRIDRLKQSVDKLKGSFDLTDKKAFKSWIDADYWLFGLIYQVMFKDKTLREDVSALISEVKTEIYSKKTQDYVKNSNRLKNLRERLKSSIDIYGKYIQ